MKTYFLDRDFRKTLSYQISGKSLKWEQSYLMRTHMLKLLVAFRNFANAPKKNRPTDY
jgi:hypothetical protein